MAAIENGFIEKEITDNSYQSQMEIETGQRVVVGLNRFTVQEAVKIPTFKVKATTEKRQIQRLKRLRKERDNGAVRESLEELRKAAVEQTNLVEPILKAVKAYATVQEICDVIRGVAGEYRSMPGAG